MVSDVLLILHVDDDCNLFLDRGPPPPPEYARERERAPGMFKIFFAKLR